MSEAGPGLGPVAVSVQEMVGLVQGLAAHLAGTHHVVLPLVVAQGPFPDGEAGSKDAGRHD